MPSLILGSICLIVALLLSVVNIFTAPIIEASKNAASNAALAEVLPGAKDFEELTVTDAYPSEVKKAYKADIGFVFEMDVSGKYAGLVVMCGLDKDGKIVATKVITNAETPDYSKKVFPEVEGASGKYTGMTLDTFSPYIVSGATMTSEGYSKAVNAALKAYVVANGGAVDNRTPEQILNDSCNEALGTTGLTFTKWFKIAELDGIDTVYVASGDAGYVMAIGDELLGVSKDGTVKDDATEHKDKLTAAYTAVESAVLTEVTKPEGAHSNIEKIEKTADGTYVIEIKAAGYQINFEYGDGVSYIFLKVAISSDGDIIDVLTISHNETDGVGSVCATDKFYSSWIGVNAGTEIAINNSEGTPGFISGATYTAEGYKLAIKRAFAAYNLLTEEGGAQ